MNQPKQLLNCQWWFLPSLAFLLMLGFPNAIAQGTNGQGTTVYVQLPPTTPQVFPYDADGLRLLGEFPMSYDLVFNGKVTFTLTSGYDFSIIPASSNAVIALPPGPFDLNGLVIPLKGGQQIGPDALGYEWVSDPIAPAGSGFMGCRDIGCIGYFTGLVSGYAGLEFKQNGQTYYGWVRVGAPLPGFNGGWIYDYAYETRPNTPISTGAGKDSDGDGVWDYLDQCPDTPPGAIVNSHGCSIEQLCPCDGPWKNHGDYVRHVQDVASQFMRDGLITGTERDAILKKAAASDCGKH